MKYMILIYSNPSNWAHPMFLYPQQTLTDQERTRMRGEFDAMLAEITESGELLSSEPLADPATSRIVQKRNGVPVTSDGPFAEAKEQLAGYFLVECETMDRAMEIAGRFPDIQFGSVEVRPVMRMGGLEM